MNGWLATAGVILRLLGIAIALAALVYAGRAAFLARDRWIERLGNPRVEAALYVAGLLFSLGMSVIARSQLETILWLLLALTFVAQLVILWRSR
jgi:hypothetical protein